MRDPIHLVNLKGYINSIKLKKIDIIIGKGIVAKGTIEQIKKCPRVKKRLLRHRSSTPKKIKEFDLNLIIITDVEIIKSLGYGTKRE